MIDAWLSSSETITSSRDRIAATVPAFDVNPDWNISAASAPLNAANRRSSSRCSDMVPAIVRTAPAAGAERGGRLRRRLLEPRVGGQPEVVVRREVDDVAAVEPRPGSCSPSSVRGWMRRTGRLELVELFLQVRERVVRHPPGLPFGSTALPDASDRV